MDRSVEEKVMEIVVNEINDRVTRNGARIGELEGRLCALESDLPRNGEIPEGHTLKVSVCLEKDATSSVVGAKNFHVAFRSLASGAFERTIQELLG